MFCCHCPPKTTCRTPEHQNTKHRTPNTPKFTRTHATLTQATRNLPIIKSHLQAVLATYPQYPITPPSLTFCLVAYTPRLFPRPRIQLHCKFLHCVDQALSYLFATVDSVSVLHSFASGCLPTCREEVMAHITDIASFFLRTLVLGLITLSVAYIGGYLHILATISVLTSHSFPYFFLNFFHLPVALLPDINSKLTLEVVNIFSKVNSEL